MKQIRLILATPVVLLLLAWIGCEVYHARSSNADGIASYGEYRILLPAPRFVQKITKNGEDFYACFGPVKPPLAMASGLPTYVFDSAGNLVDWTLDNGEDSRFYDAWTPHLGTKIDIQDFEKALAKNKITEPQR